MILDILYRYFFTGTAKTVRYVNKFYTVVQKINTARVVTQKTSNVALYKNKSGEVRPTLSTKSVIISTQNYKIQVTNE